MFVDSAAFYAKYDGPNFMLAPKGNYKDLANDYLVATDFRKGLSRYLTIPIGWIGTFLDKDFQHC